MLALKSNVLELDNTTEFILDADYEPATKKYVDILEARLDFFIAAISPPVADFTADETTIDVNGTVQFTDESTNTPTSWLWDFGDGSSESSEQNPSHVYTTDGTFTVTLTATNANGSDEEVKTGYITVVIPPPTVTNPKTGEEWMDRNLGASQVATSSTDANAYGDLYQWGRLTDGHESRTSGTTTTQSSTDNPGHSNFIIGNYDWRSPQNDNLWQGVSGTNNPCPSGFRIPTETECEAERNSWATDNAAGAFGSVLKLTVGGNRGYSNGSLSAVGSYGDYWSSTVSGTHAKVLGFTGSYTHMSSHYRAIGYSVRCIKD